MAEGVENWDCNEENEIPEYGVDVQSDGRMEGHERLKKMWNGVEESIDYARRHATWDVSGLATVKGHIPGLRLLQQGEVVTSSLLSSGQTFRAIEAIKAMQSGVTSEFELPRVSEDNWDELVNSGALLEQLPGYIETNAAILLRALYERSIEERTLYDGQAESVNMHFEKARRAYEEACSISGNGQIDVGAVERRVAGTVSEIRVKQIGWADRIETFLDDLLKDVEDVEKRRKEHMSWSPEEGKIFDLADNLFPSKESDIYQQRQILGGTITNLIGARRKKTVDKVTRVFEINSLDDGSLTAELIKERDDLVSELNEVDSNWQADERVYQACNAVLNKYGEIIMADNWNRNKDDAIWEAWKSVRAMKVDEIHDLLKNVQMLAVERLIDGYSIHMATWPDLSDEFEYDRSMMICDKKELEINRKLDNGEAFTEEDVTALTQQLRMIRLHRKYLEMEKKLRFDAELLTPDERRALARDIEILRGYRKIVGIDSMELNETVQFFEWDGQNLLLQRERESISALMNVAKGAEQEALQHDLDGIDIELKILELQGNIGAIEDDSSATKLALETNIRKLQNERRILELDRRLRERISGAERQRIMAERQVLVYENRRLDLEVLVLGNDDRIKDILFFASQISNLCDVLRGKSEQLVRGEAVKTGKVCAERKVELEKEVVELENAVDELSVQNNENSNSYLALAKLRQQQTVLMEQLRNAGKQGTKQYVEAEKSERALGGQIANLKVQLGEEADQINDLRNKMTRCLKTIVDLNKKLSGAFNQVMGLLGGNSNDVGTYRFILKFVQSCLKMATSLHEETENLVQVMTEQLVGEIVGAHESRRMSDPGTPKPAPVLDRNFKPTMMVKTGVTMYGASATDDDIIGTRSSERDQKARSRVEVIEPPKSYRHTFGGAVFDAHMWGKNGNG